MWAKETSLVQSLFMRSSRSSNNFHHLLSANLVSQIKSSMYMENDFPEAELSDLNCRLLVKLDQHYLKRPES